MSMLMRRLRHYLIVLTSSLSGLCMMLLFVIVLVNALQRYTVGRSLVWGENMAVYLMIYGIMFGIAWAYLQDKHVRFNLLQTLLPAQTQRLLTVAIDLLVLAVGIGLMFSALAFMDSRGHVRSSSTGFSMWMFHSAVLAGGTLLALSSLIMAMLRFQAPAGATEEEAGE